MKQKTFIEIRLDEDQNIYEYITQYSIRGRVGFILLWLIGVVSFKE